MKVNSIDLLSIFVQGIASIVVALIAYFTARSDHHYRQFSRNTLLADAFFAYTNGRNLKAYFESFYKSKNFLFRHLAYVVYIFEMVILFAGPVASTVLILIALFTPVAVFLNRKRNRTLDTKKVYLPMIMAGQLPEQKDLRRRPYRTYFLRTLVELNTLSFLATFLALLIASILNPGFADSIPISLAFLFDIFLIIAITGMLTPTYRDFRWLNGDTLLREITSKNKLKVRLYFGSSNKSVNDVIQGEVVGITPELVIKYKIGADSWQEVVDWKNITRVAIQLIPIQVQDHLVIDEN